MENTAVKLWKRGELTQRPEDTFSSVFIGRNSVELGKAAHSSLLLIAVCVRFRAHLPGRPSQPVAPHPRFCTLATASAVQRPIPRTPCCSNAVALALMLSGSSYQICSWVVLPGGSESYTSTKHAALSVSYWRPVVTTL